MLVAFSTLLAPSFILEALGEEDIYFEYAGNADALLTVARRGVTNVLYTYRASGFSPPSRFTTWPELAMILGGSPSKCGPSWTGIVDVDTTDMSGTPLAEFLGAVRSGPLPTGTLHFLESPVSPEQDVPFAGLVSRLTPSTSDVHMMRGLFPAGVLAEITTQHGRSVAYSADVETDPDDLLKPILRNSITYTVPQGPDPLAVLMVVVVRTTLENLAPWPVEVTLEDTLPAGSEVVHYYLPPTGGPLPTWDLSLDPWESVEIAYILRLPTTIGSYEVRSALEVREAGGGVVPVDEVVVPIEIVEDIPTARAELEVALDALEEAVSGNPQDPQDAMRVQQVRLHVEMSDSLDDGTKSGADAVIAELAIAYEWLMQVTSVPVADTCEPLTRLVRYWGWEYTRR